MKIYLGCDLSGDKAWLQFYENYFPSLLVVGAPGSWKSLGVARSIMETLLSEDWTVIYCTITPDWYGVQLPNGNPMDLETLKSFHTRWFVLEAYCKTYGIPKSRITVLTSPFWRGDLEAFRKDYGLEAGTWQIPISNVMLEAIQDFYGGGEETLYFKSLRDAWESIRLKNPSKEELVTTLTSVLKNLPAISSDFARKFISKITEWFESDVLTNRNTLLPLLKRKGHLIIFHFPQEEITAIESATFATFIHTLIDSCRRIGRNYGNNYVLIVEDVGIWSGHERSRRALESLIQRKGRKSRIFRVLIAQTEDDLTGTIKDTSKDPVFDFRIDTSVDIAEIRGILHLRGSACFLHLRKTIYSRSGKKRFRPIIYAQRPPLSAYYIRRR